VVEADNEVGLRIIENLEHDDEDMEDLLSDVSMKEEDQEIDIASYNVEQVEIKDDDIDPEDEDLDGDISVDLDKAYDEE
jgi:small subunit ribosomal protein S2